MLPEGRDDKGEDNRVEYFLLPFNHPVRVQMRRLEALLGIQYKAEFEGREASRGIFSGILSGLGAVLGVAGYIYLGPMGIVLGAIAGSAVGAVVEGSIRVRLLTPGEYDFAERVFGKTLPDRDRIILTDLTGIGGRQFVTPGSSLALFGSILNPINFAWLLKSPSLFQGKILVNMGPGFDNSSTYTRDPTKEKLGQLLIHELTHVWQIHHTSFIPGLICSGLVNQTRDALGAEVYTVEDGKQWKDYNLEQQGTIVETWFAEGLSPTHRYYRYIVSNIRAGSTTANSSPPLVLTSSGLGIKRARPSTRAVFRAGA